MRPVPRSTRSLLGVVLLTSVVMAAAACGADKEATVSDQSFTEVSDQTRKLTEELVQGLGTVTAPFQDTRTVCSDDPDATSPVSFVQEGGLRTDGPAATVLADLIDRYEKQGWAASKNGTFTNLDRDGYRMGITVGDSGQSLTVTASSPCVDDTERRD